MVQTLLKGLDPLQSKTIRLSPGQLFQGKILKLYPNQLATLNLGSITVTAKLAAPLILGERYWFEVQTGGGLPVLKVVDQLKKEKKETNGLLGKLGLGNGKVNELLLTKLSSEDIPFTREHIIKGAEVLRGLGLVNERGAETIQSLILRNIPISESTFQAILATKSGVPLSKELRELFEALQRSKQEIGSLQQLERTLDKLLLQRNVDTNISQLLQNLKMFLSEEEQSPNFKEAEQFLLKTNIIMENTTKVDLSNQIARMILQLNQAEQKWLFPQLTSEEIIKQISNHGLGKLLSYVDLNNKNAVDTLTSLLSRLHQDQNIQSNEHSQSLTLQFSNLIKNIGYQYERDVFQFLNKKESESVMTQLKSQLIHAAQLDMPNDIKEKVETILQRITGQQLLSSSQDGPVHQTTIVLPLQLGKSETDVTIQWEGKREENGKLDPDHCRVIFYLELENLNEIMMDVQVQNRVLSVQIFNEFSQPVHLMNAFQPILKESLQHLDYNLSSIKWTKTSNEHKEKNSKSPNLLAKNNYYGTKLYQGVDIRI